MSPDVYILKDGLPVFHRTIGEKSPDDVNLTAGFFHAIIEFSKLEVGENLEVIRLSNSLFYFSLRNGFTFVFRDEISAPKGPKIAARILGRVADCFFEMFPAADQWDGNESTFERFGATCDDILLIEATSPEYEVAESEVESVPSVLVEEAARQLTAIVDRANKKLAAGITRDVSDEYFSALRLMIMVPELDAYFPSLKQRIREQCESIDAALASPQLPPKLPIEPFQIPTHCEMCGEPLKAGQCAFCGAWMCPKCGRTNEVNELSCLGCRTARVKGPLKRSDFFIYKQK